MQIITELLWKDVLAFGLFDHSKYFNFMINLKYSLREISFKIATLKYQKV